MTYAIRKARRCAVAGARADGIYVIAVLGNLSPRKAAEQWTGGDDDWCHSMLYISYSY